MFGKAPSWKFVDWSFRLIPKEKTELKDSTIIASLTIIINLNHYNTAHFNFI